MNAPDIPFETLRENLADVLLQMFNASNACGRGMPQLIAVTKYASPETIKHLISLEVDWIGENRVQNVEKRLTPLFPEIKQRGVKLRMIGHLQTNKAKQALELFDAIDSVDSIRLVDALAKEAKKLNKTKIPCLAEVNVSGEAQKDGLKPAELEAFLAHAAKVPEIEIQGLMTMAPYAEGDAIEKTSRPVFKGLRELFEQANAAGWYGGRKLTELSMGMTNDFMYAIEEGATMVRIGSALFKE